MNIATTQDAIDRAIKFLRDIGHPVEADLIIHADHKPVTMNTWSVSYWKPSWEIRFRSSTGVSVDESGTISHFSLGARGSAEAPVSEMKPLTEAGARECASAIIAAMRVPEEVKVEDLTAELMQEAPFDNWWFTFHRTYEGMRCLHESFVVTVNAKTGRPSSARLNFHSFLPLSAETVISKEQAVATAERHLTAAGIKDFRYTGVNKYVVAPNDFLANTNLDRMCARVAWVCFFATANTLYVPYIDAQTGEALGGDVQFQ